MADPGPAVQLPEWVLWVGGVVGTAISLVIAKLGTAAGSKEKNTSDRVGMIASLASAPQFNPQSLTGDALVQTLSSLTLAVNKLIDVLERQEEQREEDDRDELRDLRRWKAEIEAAAGPHTRTPRR